METEVYREVQDVTDIRWLDEGKTAFDCRVLFADEEDYWPYTAVTSDKDPVMVDIFSRVLDGEFGIVPPYTPLPPQPEPIPDEISRRQFFQQLAVLEIITREEALSALTAGAIPAPLQAIIDQLPSDDDKFNAQMLVIGASTFNRTHPLAETVRQAMQWTVEQKDEFWLEASKI